ncbi:type IV pilus assembly protein FimV [Kineobactrum salinum]|uniref:Tetratricopeptide repeat protein n=1 Tax=Kineobactrum salinum TaxID=2708301 RepID=A0A6C0U9F7_9GAMM|nr:FimV/HubP family polar landmark protein [Kineobactrum salinum]QIB67275.1 tetratricopeptide repeat protein [Kineobactrum salinum]
MAHKHRLAVALVSLCCLQAASAWGLGLGNLTLESFLNEPLRARVNLLDVNDLGEDQIRIRLATSEDFDRMGVDRAYFLTSIKFDVEIDSDGRGYILLTSDEPVLEPYLDFIVEARWPSGRLLRNYTVLVDPPAFDDRSPVVSASRQVTDTQAESESESPAATSTGTEVRSSGDEVDLRESGLAPGAMPERSYGAEAAAEPQPGSRYMIRRDETLWTIAQRARPEGATVQQTMLDIQRLNPDAFIDGNINQIKAGYIVYLPASGEISSEDVAAALAQVQQQNADWREGRPGSSAAGPALRVSAGAAEPAAGAGTEAGSAAADSAAGPADTDAADTDTAASAVDTAAVLEDLERSQRERDELGQRLAAISERLETLERIVELKDSQIAALQQALDEASATADAATSGQAPAQQQAQDREAPVAAEPAAPAAAAPREEPPPPQESGSWLYILAAAVMAGLLALLFWRRRKQHEEDMAAEDGDIPLAAAPMPANRKPPDAFAGVQLQDQALEVDHSEELTSREPQSIKEPPAATAASQRGYGERKYDQYASDVDAGDALAEADIYIAYGRFPQAMELLRKAVAADPDNTAYRMKLLELAVETGEHNEASEQFAQLQRIGDDHIVARAQALMSGVGGGFAGTGGASPASPETDSYPDRSGAVDEGEQVGSGPAADIPSVPGPEPAEASELPDLSSPRTSCPRRPICPHRLSWRRLLILLITTVI